MDSYNDPERGRVYLDQCCHLMELISRLELGEYHHDSVGAGQWRRHEHQQITQQGLTDASNCGVYTLMNCLYQAFHPLMPLTFLNAESIDNYRFKIVKDLIMNELTMTNATVFKAKVAQIL